MECKAERLLGSETFRCGNLQQASMYLTLNVQSIHEHSNYLVIVMQVFQPIEPLTEKWQDR